MKSLYLYQLLVILFGLIIDPPSTPKKEKKQKIPKIHTQTKHPQQMQPC